MLLSENSGPREGEGRGAKEGKGHWGALVSLGPGVEVTRSDGTDHLVCGIGRICASSWPLWQKDTMMDQQKLQVNRRKPTEARAGAGLSGNG